MIRFRTRASSGAERFAAGKVKCLPALGSTAQKTFAVPQRSYSLSRLATRPDAPQGVLADPHAERPAFRPNKSRARRPDRASHNTARTSSILRRYSASRSATRHIFFPPRLQIVAAHQNPDGLTSHARNQLSLHGFLGDQPHRPPRLSLGGLTAYHRDHALLFGGIQQFLGTTSLSLVQSPFESCLLIAMGDPPNCLGER